jgi:hypothetical protein
MPDGVQYPDIIDKVVKEKDGGALLIMIERRPWDGSDSRIAELRQKLNTYATYARQGQLAKDFPDLAGKPVSFLLWSILHKPDPKTMAFLDQANAQLAKHSLRVGVRIIEAVTPEMQRQERERDGKPWWKIW